MNNVFLANLRFLKPENKAIKGEKMMLGVAASMPPVYELTPREMDALTFEWKLLILEDVPEPEKKNGHICVTSYWQAIFNIEDDGEPKFPLLQKVVRFALSIAEANGDVERIFSQVLNIVDKDRNRLSTDSLRGLLITKSYLQAIGSCLNFEIDQSMMTSIKASHSKYIERTGSKNDDCVHKRVIEDANKTFLENKRIKSIEARKKHIEKQEEEIRSNRSKATLLLDNARRLMEDSENMAKFLEKEKKELEKSEKQVQKSIIKSTCRKVVKKHHQNTLSNVDVNNNESE